MDSINEVFTKLVNVKHELHHYVICANAQQRKDEETIAQLQSELLKAEQRAEKQELRADTSTDMLLATREQLARTKTELVRVNNELVNQREQQTPRPPAKRKLFGDGDHDVVIHLYDLETPKKK